MTMVWYGFWFLVFPGFAFAALIGMLASWLDRKLAARIQYRQGPPLLQPFWDLRKLLSKEAVIPRSASRPLFLLSPLLGLAGATVAASMLGVAAFWPGKSFVGDLIVLLYFLLFPGLALMLGGLSSRNPIAALGAAREMKLIFSYEPALLAAISVVLVKTRGELSLSNIVSWQAAHGPVALSVSGALALLLALFAVQAKLSAVPFDLAEAETEIASGVLIEYSGFLLGIFRLTRMIMLYLMPALLVMLFLGGIGPGPAGILMGLLKFLALLAAFILIRSLSPRLRTDQALKFFWKGGLGLGLVAIALALRGW